MNTTRGAFREVLPGRLLQRAQILTWQREPKLAALREAGVTAITNLWPKPDPELADSGLDFILQLSCHRSEDMQKPHVELAARAAADYLQFPGKRLLVLCEAGKTRSVMFCIMVTAFHNHWTATQAREHVLTAVPTASLKPWMQEWVAT
jgi:hypothetical protein